MSCFIDILKANKCSEFGIIYQKFYIVNVVMTQKKLNKNKREKTVVNILKYGKFWK